MTAAVRVTTDLDDIDLDVVHRWLSEEAYWALGRSREVVEAAARASVNFGALDADGRLVGYARVVTDRVTFAWLCDVFVDPAARGLGAGKALAGAVVAAVRPMGLKRVMLATADAHELYRRFGFEGVTDPEKLMILAQPSAQRGADQEAV
ncbi:GNAT family N-acetyltransferase [Microbacterium arabinogalactanolyticum]|uniref:GNAT family N-acetyltransferase n=1 Tax=Microbacterium arabinogalactanolyticum TaxID=69365 RepID=UPI0025538FA9|nr:GNAT family N-acetyltransferase [Microbacterium arabinogalactanolyticum]GLC84400.1 N-acetyltransferase [Microbacterium arabinogalactanolyticum]